MGRFGVVALFALLALGACGGRAPAPRACIEAQPADVLQALAHAPRHVALADGTPLSQCVRLTVDDVRLQALGAAFVAAADRLAVRMRRSEADAFRLGYLIGATSRGADQTAGLQGELANRVAGSAGPDGGPHRAALLRGRAAGRHGG